MNRYIRLNTGWYTSEWIIPLSAEVRLCWVLLLGYVKANGIGGRVKALNALTASRMWFVGEESIRQMIIAAQNHGAIAVENGEWIIVKWGEYQSDATNAERQARFREAHRGAKSNGSNALRNVVTTEEKRREEKKVPPKPPKGAYVLPESLESIRESFDEFLAHRIEMKKPVTPLAFSKVVASCERMGATVAARQIAECIEKSWRVPYPPKSEPNSLPGRDAKTAGSPF